MSHKLLTFFTVAFICIISTLFASLKDVQGEGNAVTDLFAISLTNEPTTILYWTSPIKYDWTSPGDFPFEGYEVGYSTIPITESNWEQTTKMAGVKYESLGYARVENLNLANTYYFAVKAYSSSGNYTNLSSVVFAKITDSVKSWDPSSFNEMTDNSWYNLKPALPPGSTSQVFLGYDPVRDMLMTWGGHPYGGGYPQVDEIYAYSIADRNQANTWKIEDCFMPDTSDKPTGGCCTGGIYDEFNQVMVKQGQHRTDRYEYYRKLNFEGWPWIYDFSKHKWYDLKAFNYNRAGGENGPGLAYDSDDQIVVIVEPNPLAPNRVIIYDTYANKVTRIPPFSWRDLGGDGQSRSDMGLVYDTKRHRFVVVGGVKLAAEGVSFAFNDVWTLNLRNRKWVKEAGIQNPDIVPVTGRVSATSAVYDPIHDKILLFEVLNVGSIGTVRPSRVLLTLVYDPETKSWRRGNDKPGYAESSRPLDLNAVFSEKYNAAFILGSGRPLDNSSGNISETWAYRYSTNVPPQTKPNPPQNASLETTSNSAILKWQPSNSSGVTSYNIYRAQAENSWEASYSKITTLPSSATSYTDSSITPGKIYFYYVTAANGQGAESEASLKVRSQPNIVREGYVSVLTDKQTKVHWTQRDKDVVGYNIYRAEVTNFETYPINQALNAPGELSQYARPAIRSITQPTEQNFIKLNSALVATNEYTDNNISLSNSNAAYPYKVYAYRIKAVNKCGVESGWSPYWLTIPNPPTRLKVSQDASNFYLAWTAPHNGELVNGYRVYAAYSDHGVKEITSDIITQTNIVIPKGAYLGTYQRFYVSAIDKLNQEGIPSAGEWGNRIHGNIYKQYYEFGITTCFLRDGIPGQAYNIGLQVVNGAGPFRWQIVSGSLPGGLILNNDGKISGTPGQAGSYTFTVKVTDSSVPAQEATRQFSLRVEAITIPPTAEANGPYEGQVNTPLTLNAGGSYDTDGAIVLYEWDINGDGTWDIRTDKAIVAHTWSVPYGGNIRLRVTDNDGLTATDTTSVVVMVPPPPGVKGDLDGDGDVDRNDLNILLSYRNKPASARLACDLDGDGMITVLDARKLVLLCTRPNCACE